MAYFSHWSYSPMRCHTHWGFWSCFFPKMMNWGEDKQSRAWINNSIYNMKITWGEEKRRSKQTDNLPTVIPLLQVGINHWLNFIQWAPWKITIICQNSNFLQNPEYAHKQNGFLCILLLVIYCLWCDSFIIIPPPKNIIPFLNNIPIEELGDWKDQILSVLV